MVGCMGQGTLRHILAASAPCCLSRRLSWQAAWGLVARRLSALQHISRAPPAVGSLVKPHQTSVMVSGSFAMDLQLDAGPVEYFPLTPQLIAERLPTASAAVGVSS